MKKKRSPILEEIKSLAPVPEGPDAPLSIREEIAHEITLIKEATAMDLARSGAKHFAILEALGVPSGLDGAALDQWCAGELSQLRVKALAIQRYMMVYGSKAEAARASEKILDITEREKGVPSSAPIIIINGATGITTAPWRTIEGKVSDVPSTSTVEDVAPLQARSTDGEGDGA